MSLYWIRHCLLTSFLYFEVFESGKGTVQIPFTVTAIGDISVSPANGTDSFAVFVTDRFNGNLKDNLLYYYIVEPVARYKIPDEIGDFLPKKAIGTMIDIPNTAIMRLFGVEFQDYISLTDALVVLAYVVLFAGLSYWIIKKRDL